MKIAKRAEQKNIVLNRDYYTPAEINLMLAAGEIFYFKEFCQTSTDPVDTWDFDRTDFRIYTDDLSEIKVVLDEYKFYSTVAVGKNGKTYFVNI